MTSQSGRAHKARSRARGGEPRGSGRLTLLKFPQEVATHRAIRDFALVDQRSQARTLATAPGVLAAK